MTTNIHEKLSYPTLAGDGGHFWHRDGFHIIAVDEEGREHHVCEVTNREDVEDFEANADLLLAAPELLVSCKALLEYLIDDNPGGFLGGDAWMSQLADNARAAISKATGEKQ